MCSACERSLLPASPGAATAIEVVARFEYRFPVDRLLHRFKFGGDLAIGRWLGLQLARELTDCPRPHRLVVPPLANPRLKERGFNQALELAKVLGHRLGIPVERAALSRSAAAPPQTGLGRSERLRNLAGAFSCRRDFSGQDVAIVDDVTTTGATGEAIAGVLRAAGARRVRLWVVARTP